MTMSFSLHHPLEYDAKVGERCIYAGGSQVGPIPCKVESVERTRDGDLRYNLKVTGHRSRIYPYGYKILDVPLSFIRRPKKTSARRSR